MVTEALVTIATGGEANKADLVTKSLVSLWTEEMFVVPIILCRRLK